MTLHEMGVPEFRNTASDLAPLDTSNNSTNVSPACSMSHLQTPHNLSSSQTDHGLGSRVPRV